MNKRIGIGLGIIVVLLLVLFGVRHMMEGSLGQATNSYMDGEMMGLGMAAKQAGYSGGQDTFGLAADYAEEAVRQVLPPVPRSSASPDTTAGQERLIIKSGDMSLLVEDVPLASDQLKRFAEAQGGFVVSSNLYERRTAPVADVTIRIPVENFDQSLISISDIGEVVSQSVNGQDVTEEFVDLDAQIRNLRSTEEQFLVIMKQATRIQDILDVQRELSNVRSQIERIEGRMNYLTKSAKMSTLRVHLSTNPELLPVVEEPSWKPLAVAKDALRSLREVGIALVNAGIWIVVYIPLWILLGLIIRWGYRKAYKKQ